MRSRNQIGLISTGYPCMRFAFATRSYSTRKSKLVSSMAACRCCHMDTSNDNVDLATLLVVVGLDVDVDIDMENAC